MIWNFYRSLKVFLTRSDWAARGGAEPLTQTRLGKMWWWKARSIEYANNFVATSRRALRGVGYEPEARAGLNLEP